MAKYYIEFTEEAKTDLYQYSASERKIIIGDIRIQLGEQPLIETKNRKKLRENPVSPWELRVRKYRIFYQVDEASQSVTIIAIGHREHNSLLIRGKEVKI
ncbi:type II toxin-antitoxin system RelE/ParE family toxin [Candidatus Sumerlaeota bacterium]|nr:type II toxin-antitoxin system RelE/ParE family toxin [Candidatus Sumerlaeota bacterium]